MLFGLDIDLEYITAYLTNAVHLPTGGGSCLAATADISIGRCSGATGRVSD